MATDPPEYLPYFQEYVDLTYAAAQVYKNVGAEIAERKYVYNRATFYLDVAMAIRKLLELEFQPLMASSYNWDWWAGELEKRGEALGPDAPYSMVLPGPFCGGYEDNPELTNRLDEVVSLMTGVYQQEEDDSDVGGLGQITPAECVKITHRFCRYYLWNYCSEYERGYRVPWPWLKAVTEELQQLYRKMGEKDRAGSSGTPGGPIPPISWPGA